MVTYLVTVGVILGVLGGWVAVQNLSRRFAAQHPEFGPYREKGGGCGACSGKCSSDSESGHCEK